MVEDKDRDQFMNETRAAVAYVNTRNSEVVKAYAFLSQFHPELSHEDRMQMARDMADE